MAPPMCRFAGGPADAELCGWSGEWPPPEELLYMVGRQSGLMSWSERYLIHERGISVDDVFAAANVYSYRRVSFSTLPTEVDENPHLFRAAQYDFVEQLTGF